MAKTGYAATTMVSPEKTQAEIRALVYAHDATGYGVVEEGRRCRVQFRLQERYLRFDLLLPDPAGEEYLHDNGNYRWEERPPQMRQKAWEQDVRAMWRRLLLVIKAKFESIDSAIETLEEAFLSHIVVPTEAGDATVGEWLLPQIAEAYSAGRVPRLLPGASAPLLLGPGDTRHN